MVLVVGTEKELTLASLQENSAAMYSIASIHLLMQENIVMK
jgi:hypothetical protein